MGRQDHRKISHPCLLVVLQGWIRSTQDWHALSVLSGKAAQTGRVLLGAIALPRAEVSNGPLRCEHSPRTVAAPQSASAILISAAISTAWLCAANESSAARWIPVRRVSRQETCLPDRPPCRTTIRLCRWGRAGSRSPGWWSERRD